MSDQLVELSVIEKERYTAQIQLCEIGLEGQKRLKSASVAVVGAGGLGCANLLYLAAAGVGTLAIIDHDRIELSNLQRQLLYQQEDVGELKCIVAKRRLTKLNPHAQFHSVEARITVENAKALIRDYTVIIDATDNFTARYALNDACVELAKPFIYGSISHFEGQVALFNAQQGSPDYRALYPAPPTQEQKPTCSEGGVIAPLPGLIGSIQALEAIKVIVGIEPTLSGKLLKVDALSWNTRLYQIGAERKCLEIDALTLHQLLQKAEVF